MQSSARLIEDLETAVRNGSQEQLTEIMRSVTALFLGDAERFTSEQVNLFDDIFTRLTAKVESEALVDLGTKLAPVDNAPKAIIKKLARHDEIQIAGPVLAQSSKLSEQELITIAKIKGQNHLKAISERKSIGAAITDVLITKGNNDVVHTLSGNAGASFSDTGFNALAKRAETDDKLAETLTLRPDLSPQQFRQLVLKATEAVRARLLASANPELQATIRNVIDSASNKAASPGRNFTAAEAVTAKMHANNQLTESAIVNFANAGKYEELIAGLAKLCSSSSELVDQLMQNPDYKAILVACKAAQLRWPAFRAILNNRNTFQQAAPLNLAQAQSDFLKLPVPTAQRMFRFWTVRGVGNDLATWKVT